jgi:hypothetical protein
MGRKEGTTVMPAAWDQLRDEPDDGYSWFLHFRNLGPGRTLSLAYNAFCDTFANANQEVTNSAKPRRVSGQWATLSAHWRWCERAADWDQHNFKLYGKRAAVKFVAALDKVADRVCEALARPGMRPRKWDDLVKALAIIQAYAGPVTIAEFGERASDPPSESGSVAGAENKPEPVAATDDGTT